MFGRKNKNSGEPEFNPLELDMPEAKSDNEAVYTLGGPDEFEDYESVDFAEPETPPEFAPIPAPKNIRKKRALDRSDIPNGETVRQTRPRRASTRTSSSTRARGPRKHSGANRAISSPTTSP